MKKLITILLVLTIIFSCFALVGCSIKDIIDDFLESRETLPEGIVKTKVTLDNGENIYIAHGENFTQDDIDFVVMRHGVKDESYIPCDLISYCLGNALSSGSNLYLARFENPYRITAYLKPDAPEYEDPFDYAFDVSKYIWIKSNLNEDIPSRIEDEYTKTTFSYVLYDCTIRKDIVNGIEYNQKYKYYTEYKKETAWYPISEDMLVWTPLYVNERFIAGFRTKDIVYIDESGKEYLVFWSEIFDSRNENTMKAASALLGEHYDMIFPNCTRNEALDVKEYNDNGKDYYLFRMVQIEIDVLVDLLYK
jgi:hypothetical protein